MADPNTPQPPEGPPRDKRIVKHIRAMAEGGADIEKFVKALHAFRDDASLTSAQREAIFKTMAQDAAQAYYVMTTGEAIDLEKLHQAIEPSES
jgi:hypothetical protein